MDKADCIPICGPYLFYPQKEGTLQMCIDYRMLNKQIKISAYSVPQVDEILDCQCKARVFFKINLSKAYHQVAVEWSHTYTHKTTFLTKCRLFKFLFLPLDWWAHYQYSNGWLILLFKSHSNISYWLTLIT